MRRLSLAMIGLVSLSLTGCGGGDSSGGGGGPIAAPAPSPSPSPSPSPTPTPSATYETVSDFSRDHTYRVIGIEFRMATNSAAGGARFLSLRRFAPNDFVVATFKANPGRLSLAAGTAPPFADYTVVTDRSNSFVAFASGAGPAAPDNFAISQYGPSQGNLPSLLKYTVALNGGYVVNPDQGGTEFAQLALVGGTPTLGSDLPTSGNARFAGIFTAQGYTPANENRGYAASGSFGNSGYFELAADFAAKTITGRIPAIRTNDGTAVAFSLTGTFTGSGTLEGTITNEAGAVGSFVGSFHGPRGAELGLAITFNEGEYRFGGNLVAVVLPTN